MTLELSLAEWSLHREIQAGRLTTLDFPRVARAEFQIDAVELVSTLMGPPRKEVLRELRRRADGEGVQVLLIMVDDEGDLCHPRPRTRHKAARRHWRWVDAAEALGCHAIRVNTGGEGRLFKGFACAPAGWRALEDMIERCAESLADIADHARPAGISVLLENHGGLSSNIDALVRVVAAARRENTGTLPDFGNWTPGVDPYGAVERMLPLARAVSAKTFDFDQDGMETTIDYRRMMALVRESGYSGRLGIEYEGTRLPELEGVRRSKALIQRILEDPAGRPRDSRPSG